MPIILGSDLSSQVANDTWVDKTQNDTTVGILTLANVEVVSGNTVANPQREINKNGKIVFGESAKVGGDTLTLDALSMRQEFRLIGTAGATTLNALPFTGAQVAIDGTEIFLIGHSDTDTVTITLNDVAFGCYINGGATLKRGYILHLVYNNELERYFEVGRNF